MVLLTRKRIDRLFAWTLLPSLCVTALLIWLDGWKYWPSAFVLFPPWLATRFLVPKRGLRGERASASPGIGWLGAALLVLFAGTFLSEWNKLVAVAGSGLIFLYTMSQFFRCANADDRRRRELWAMQADTADARWRELTATPEQH